MTTKWDHLPNATYIDLILAELTVNPYKWAVARTAATPATYDVAYSAAIAVTYSAARTAVLEVVWAAILEAVGHPDLIAATSAELISAFTTARDATLALVAYDDCAHILTEKAEYVQMVAWLGDPAAVLLYLACIALR